MTGLLTCGLLPLAALPHIVCLMRLQMQPKSAHAEDRQGTWCKAPCPPTSSRLSTELYGACSPPCHAAETC